MIFPFRKETRAEDLLHRELLDARMHGFKRDPHAIAGTCTHTPEGERGKEEKTEGIGDEERQAVSVRLLLASV